METLEVPVRHWGINMRKSNGGFRRYYVDGKHKFEDKKSALNALEKGVRHLEEQGRGGTLMIIPNVDNLSQAVEKEANGST